MENLLTYSMFPMYVCVGVYPVFVGSVLWSQDVRVFVVLWSVSVSVCCVDHRAECQRSVDS